MTTFSKCILTLAALTCFQANAQTPAASPEMPTSAGTTTKDSAVSDAGGAIKVPRVFFIEPKDGATVKGPEVKVLFGLEGMKIAKAGVVAAGTGHHHLIIDGQPVKNGTVIPSDKKHLHFGAEQTEATVTLPKGKHTLTLQFADGNHTSYGPMMTQTISITVK